MNETTESCEKVAIDACMNVTDNNFHIEIQERRFFA